MRSKKTHTEEVPFPNSSMITSALLVALLIAPTICGVKKK